MRTTLTLDDALVARLKDLAHRRGESFKDTVNAVVRRGLDAQGPHAPRPKPFTVKPFRSAFRPGVDPAKLNQLVDALDAEAVAPAPR